MSRKKPELSVETKKPETSPEVKSEDEDSPLCESAQELLETIANADEQLIIVDFYTPDCGPCKNLAPLLDKWTEEFKGKLRVFKVDISQEVDLANTFEITRVPTLFFFRQGSDEPCLAIEGVNAKEIYDNIKKELALSSSEKMQTQEEGLEKSDG